MSKLHAQVFEFCKSVSAHLIPQTTAYHEIWLDKKMVAGDALKDFEPLYGDFYLPRKVMNDVRHLRPVLTISSSKSQLQFPQRMMWMSSPMI
jgi:hypothetical protein